ncbi:mucin-22-like [Nilaparvata lugens]|uniref:mucin-22-like n=1 Tax=Nilaparvata lugens TaxID=108931 RepID=UPI00193D23D7|nr:mucin-22-like [Nilaparvata lugens]
MVLLEFQLGASWGGDTAVEAIFDQDKALRLWKLIGCHTGSSATPIRMSDEPPAELFGSDSLPETDDVIKGDETMQFSTSEESSKMVNADLQKVMDSISVSADGVDVDDEKLLSQFVVGNLGADDHHHGPTTAEESSSSSLADERALLESVLARAANSDQVATLGDQVATLGGQVATLGGQGRTLGSLVGALSGHVASPAAGDETPEETMQVERLMESIHSGSSNDEPKTLQDDDDTISSTTIAVPTTTTYQSLTSLQAAADIFGDDEDDDDDVIKAAGMQSSTADDNGSQQTVMTALVGGGGVITASGGGYVMTSSSSGGGQLMTSSVVREEEELTSVEDVLSALHSELDEEEEIKKVEEKSKWKLKVEQQRQQQAQVTKPAKPSSDGASGPMYKCFVSGCKSTTSSAAGSGATSGGKSVTTSAGAGSGATSGGKSVTTSAGAGSGATSGGEMRFFKPPPNPLIFKRWARNLCQGSQQLAYTALICELHFRPQDIREVFVNGKKNWVLTEGALPKPSTASALAAAAAQAGNAAAAAMNSRPPGGKRPVGRPSGLYRQQQFEALQAAQARANKLQREKLSQGPAVVKDEKTDQRKTSRSGRVCVRTLSYGVPLCRAIPRDRARVQCRGTSTFKASLSESKPHVWAFLLWKNAQTKILGETESSWKLYQRWCKMTDQLRETWIAAGRDLQANSCVVQHLQSIKVCGQC